MPVIVSSSAGGQTIISGSAMSSSVGNFFSGSTTLSSSHPHGDEGPQTKDLYLGSGQTRYITTYKDLQYGDDWLYISHDAGRINMSASLSIELMGNTEDDGVMVTNSPFHIAAVSQEEENPNYLFTVGSTLGSIYTSGSLAIGLPEGNEQHVLALDVHYTGSAEASGSRPGNLGHDKGGGEVVYFGTASAGMSTGAVYYLNSDGGWQSADSANTGSGHNQLLGMALGGNPGTNGMLVKGYFHVDSYLSGAFIVGGPLYIQSSSIDRLHTEGGYLSGAAPSVADSYVRVVGYGISSSAPQPAHVIYFNPDSTYVEIS